MVIQPNCRTQFTAADIDFIVSVFKTEEGPSESLVKLFSDPESLDALLDHDLIFKALLERTGFLKVSRMNPNKGRSAAALIAALKESELRDLLIENADEPHADLLAEAIVESREKAPIFTTRALTQLLQDALSSLPRQQQEVDGSSSIRRVYQALRVCVNEEFSNLERFLRILPSSLKPGGRVVILSFHSGEDRRVKKAFQAGLREGLYGRIAEDVVRASMAEVRANSRSSSAKLRWAIRSNTELNKNF